MIKIFSIWSQYHYNPFNRVSLCLVAVALLALPFSGCSGGTKDTTPSAAAGQDGEGNGDQVVGDNANDGSAKDLDSTTSGPNVTTPAPGDVTNVRGTCEAGCANGFDCVNGSCLLKCEAGEQVCGVGGGNATCCDVGDVCHLSKCTSPGAMCDSLTPCASAEDYCDTLLGRCLPKAAPIDGLSSCEVRPDPLESLNMIEEGRWESDDQFRTLSDQVMMTPSVANLNDDNGDGKIDQNDIPDIIFSTFVDGRELENGYMTIGSGTSKNTPPQGNSWYNHTGTLRAVSGDTLEPLESWPKSNDIPELNDSDLEQYYVRPGASVAVADLIKDNDHPGPEIVACESHIGDYSTDPYPADNTERDARFAQEREDDVTAALIISNTGRIIRRLPNIPCEGNVGPVIGDMDNDGTPEIGIMNKVFHADGTEVFTASGQSSDWVPSMVDIDGDGDLEYVTAYGVYDHDGVRRDTKDAFFTSTSMRGAGRSAVADVIREPAGTPQRPEIVVVYSGIRKSGHGCDYVNSDGVKDSRGIVRIIDTKTWEVKHEFLVNAPAVANETDALLESLKPANDIICEQKTTEFLFWLQDFSPHGMVNTDCRKILCRRELHLVFCLIIFTLFIGARLRLAPLFI